MSIGNCTLNVVSNGCDTARTRRRPASWMHSTSTPCEAPDVLGSEDDGTNACIPEELAEPTIFCATAEANVDVVAALAAAAKSKQTVRPCEVTANRRNVTACTC